MLINIYNSHITQSSKISDELRQSEENFEKICKSSGELPNLLILQILSKKISEVIHGYKSMIFQKSEIKRMRQCYLKMVEDKMPSIIPESESDDYLSIGKALVLPSYVIEQSEEGNRKNIITNFLNDLYYIKQALISSSEEIQKIFSHSLSFLLQGEDKVNFDFAKIHIEEFNHIILDDNFITLLLLEIKKRQLEGILTMLHFIEDNPLSPSKESTRFKEAVGIQIKIVRLSRRRKKVFESLAESKESKKNEKSAVIEYVSKNSNFGFEALSLKETREIDTIINDKSDKVKPTVKKTKKNSGNSEIKELDIDQLVDFITRNENSKSKKSKKKKNKKKGNSDNTTETSSHNKSNEDDDEIDKEIEIVKQTIKKESFNKYTIRKIQPHISQDWINSITVST